MFVVISSYGQTIDSVATLDAPLCKDSLGSFIVYTQGVAVVNYDLQIEVATGPFTTMWVTVDNIIFVAVDASGRPVRHDIDKFEVEGRWTEEKPIDSAIKGCINDYEEEIELYKTYGGD